MFNKRPQSLYYRSSAKVKVAICGFLVTILIALQWSVFVGYQASDDASYLRGALGWLSDTAYVGTDHWTLRHTLTLPGALSIWIFGLNRLSISLPIIIYFISFIILQFLALSRWLTIAEAIIFCVFEITMSGMVVNSTYMAPDVSEVFFVSMAFWLLVAVLNPIHSFHAASQDKRIPRLLLVVGVLTGLAWINRQTAGGALLAFGLLIWMGHKSVWRHLPWLAFGFLMVVGIEWLYLTIMTGDPLYRINLDLNHDPVDRFAEVRRLANAGGLIDKEGNLSVNVFIDPILALLVTQKYGLIFWVGLAGAWRLRTWNEGLERWLLQRVLLVGVLSFLFVAINPKLYLVPRYLMLSAWAATVLAAWWVATLWRSQRRQLAFALAGMLVGMNLLCLLLENTQPRAIEQALVAWVKDHPGKIVHTDPETFMRAEYFFRFANVSPEQVRTNAPEPGDLLFYSETRVKQCSTVPHCKDRAVAFYPKPQWAVVEQLVGPVKSFGQIAQVLGLLSKLPPDIARRIGAPTYQATLYKVL